MLENTKAAVIQYLEIIGKPVIDSQVNRMVKRIMGCNTYTLYYSLGETHNVENIIKTHVNQATGLTRY